MKLAYGLVAVFLLLTSLVAIANQTSTTATDTDTFQAQFNGVSDENVNIIPSNKPTNKLRLAEVSTEPPAEHEDAWSRQTLTSQDGAPLAIATTTSSEGFMFNVTRLADGAVAAFFVLPSWVDDELAPQHLPVVKVDTRPPVEMGALRIASEHLPGFYYELEPDWFGFRIWHGKDDDGISRDIINLMMGNTLLVEFHLQKYGKQDVSFTLSGANAAIASAISVDPNFDRGKQAASSALRSIFADELERCTAFDGRKQKYCFDRLFACEQLSERVAEALIECLDH